MSISYLLLTEKPKKSISSQKYDKNKCFNVESGIKFEHWQIFLRTEDTEQASVYRYLPSGWVDQQWVKKQTAEFWGKSIQYQTLFYKF